MLGIGERLRRAAVRRYLIISGLRTPAIACKDDMFAIERPGLNEHDKRSECQLLAFAPSARLFQSVPSGNRT